MQTVNIHEAKTHFSKLLEKVEGGEEIIIARAGHPIAKLIAWEESPNKIAAPGGLADKNFWITDDFDELIDELFES
jgi:prevent-host-death family protein